VTVIIAVFYFFGRVARFAHRGFEAGRLGYSPPNPKS